MKKYFLISAFGKDKVGIVASLSKVLYENGFNLEDSSMSKLGGEFTVMLVVSTDKNMSEGEVSRLFDEVKKNLGLQIYVKELKEEEVKKEKPKEDSIYRIVVYGADKPGIVYKTTKLLADNNVSILDMTTEKSGDLYILLTEVALPEGLSFNELKSQIKGLQDEIGVDISCEKIESVEL